MTHTTFGAGAFGGSWALCGMVSALWLSGCAMSRESGPPGIGETTIASETFTVDRVSTADDGLEADGELDAVLSAEVTGPVTALLLVSVNDAGEHLFDEVWDTIVGTSEFPTEIGAHFETGGETWVLGVEENGVMLNRADGSLAPLSAGPHALTLYASSLDVVPIRGGFHYRLVALMADGTLVYGPVVQHP
jgi:hypothetical protein